MGGSGTLEKTPPAGICEEGSQDRGLQLVGQPVSPTEDNVVVAGVQCRDSMEKGSEPEAQPKRWDDGVRRMEETLRDGEKEDAEDKKEETEEQSEEHEDIRCVPCGHVHQKRTPRKAELRGESCQNTCRQ